MKLTVGAYVVIQIAGDLNHYIAEVVTEDPLILKVQESGPYAKLKRDEIIIDERRTLRLQDKAEEPAVLKQALDRGKPLVSGLASLGITDGNIYPIVPDGYLG